MVKLRALYQRRKGRDLFDLAMALETTTIDPQRIVRAFSEYMNHEGRRVTRAQFERNLASKLHNAQFIADMGPLLATSYNYYPDKAAELVSKRLVALLPGDPWKKPKPQ
jgi:predicted nucleotidyltransferase component of viral defense system